MFLRIATLTAVVVASAVIGSASPADAVMRCSKGYYKRPRVTASTAFSENPDEDYTCHGHNGAS
jgi:hypothetical protein